MLKYAITYGLFICSTLAIGTTNAARKTCEAGCRVIPQKARQQLRLNCEPTETNEEKMHMLYFGIPLISREAALDWGHTVNLLNNTLASIAQQTDKRVHALIACHDTPPIHKHFLSLVTFLPVNTPIPTTVSEMRLDKGRKKLEAGQYLRKLGGGYLMFLDSDDLVHKNLAAHVLNANNPFGYIVKSGYEYYSSTGRLLLQKDNFNQICGSCAIFKLKPEDLPEHSDDTDCFHSKLQSHKEFENVCRAHNRPLSAIPFPAVIYLRTSNITISTRFFKATGLRLWKNRIKQFLLRKKLTPVIRNDFSLTA